VAAGRRAYSLYLALLYRLAVLFAGSLPKLGAQHNDGFPMLGSKVLDGPISFSFPF
jgi:hypothetical protein